MAPVTQLKTPGRKARRRSGFERDDVMTAAGGRQQPFT
jgi:hypothetical protein